MRDDYGAAYARLYHGHWWWRAREAILLGELARLGLPPGAEVLDVGCGDGLFFPGLARFGRVRGVEVDEALLDPSGPHRPHIFTRPLGDPLYRGEVWTFDLITALDVIEHLDDDRAAVAAMAAMLRPGGALVVTVPASPRLWDRHDEINHHRRRYTAASLRSALEGQGLEGPRVRYLFRSLYAPKLAVSRLNRARRGRPVEQHATPPPWLNASLARFCRLEDRLLRRVPLPFGTSLLAVARRPAIRRDDGGDDGGPRN